MSYQLLPTGLKSGDGLGDFMTFSTETIAGPSGAGSQGNVGDAVPRRDFGVTDAVWLEDRAVSANDYC